MGRRGCLPGSELIGPLIHQLFGPACIGRQIGDMEGIQNAAVHQVSVHTEVSAFHRGPFYDVALLSTLCGVEGLLKCDALRRGNTG